MKNGVTGYIVKSKNIEDLTEKLQNCEKTNDWKYEILKEVSEKKYSGDNYAIWITKRYSEILHKK